MPRPTKSVKSSSGKISKAEKEYREREETRLRGGDDKLTPPAYLTDDQKEIFAYIIDNLKEAGLLGNLDNYILTFTSITIDRMIHLDTVMNCVPVTDPRYDVLTKQRSALAKDFFRCLNELSLTPQARAKISLASIQSTLESKNPLLEALAD